MATSADPVIAQVKAEKLRAYFAPDEVLWRAPLTLALVPAGSEVKYKPFLAYFAIVDRLDTVFGPHNWRVRYENPGDGSATRCVIEARYTDDGEWVTRVGITSETEPESALAESFREAALDFGVGRYLVGVKFSTVRTADGIKDAPKLSDHLLPDSYRECGRETARVIRDLLAAAVREADAKGLKVTEDDALRELVWRNGGDPDGRVLSDKGVYLSRVQNRHATAIMHAVKLWVEDIARGTPNGPSAPIKKKDSAPSAATSAQKNTAPATV